MGLFKQFKDMKATLAAAPEMVEQAQEMSANAQAMLWRGLRVSSASGMVDSNPV